MFFGYLQAKGAGEVSMAIENVQHARYPVSIIGPTIVGPGNFLKIEALRWLENAILNLVFANNRAILPIF